MTPEYYQRICQLFDEALERPPAERAAFLDRACGADAELRAEVDKLLANHREDEEFLERPALEAAAAMLAQRQQTALLGRQLSRYEILARLGAGGMGEVWLAEDRSLQRKVALKLLPAQLTADADRVRRFEQEAKAASALNHPNIISVYDIGESDVGRFIVMELVAGRTLREVIATDNSVATVLALGQQMAKALAAAHAAGITHRDIKPDNIMVRDDGYVKVLDFGLARLLPPNAQDSEAGMQAQQTAPGTVLGTVAYMSPEQARGESVDPASDIFALGIVLYELATGRHPFEAETLVGYLHAITLQTPAPPWHWQPKLPVALNELLLRMLNKEASRRPTATEVMEALSSGNEPVAAQPTSPGHAKPQKWWLAAGLGFILLVGGYFGRGYFTTTRQIESIAVMPFGNESGNADVEYLSDGMTESLIRSLSQMPNLAVKARSTVFRYKGKEVDIPSLGRELGVQAILKGRFSKRAEQITLDLELVNVGDESVIWTDQYQRKFADLVALQNEIGREVSSKLTAKLSGADVARLNKQQTADPVAYQLYLQGRYEAGKFTEDGYSKCIEHLNQAITRDPNFALAYDGLSFCYYANWYLSAKIIAEKGRVAATRALELDPNLPEAHASLATIAAWFHYDWEPAEKGFRRAIEIDPKLGLAHSYYGVVLASLGRFDEAIGETEKGVELEPFSAEINAMLGLVYFYSGKCEKAAAQFRKTIEIDPSFWYAHTQLARSIEKLGDRETAESMLEKARSMQGATAEPLMNLGRIYAASGRRTAAKKIIAELKAPKWTIQMDGYEFAVIYAALGDKDTAFAYLETEYAHGSWWLNFAKIDPDLDPLRSDPRFYELLKKLNLSK